MKSLFVGIVMIAAATVVLACTDLTSPGTGKAVTSTQQELVAFDDGVILPSDPRRIAVWQRVQFYGDFHDRAMRDLMDNMAWWRRGLGAKKTRDCLAGVRVLMRYGPELDAHLGQARTVQQLRDDAISAVRNTPHCRDVDLLALNPLSVFPPTGVASAATGFRPPTATLEDSLAYGAFQPYVESIDAQVAALINPTRSQMLQIVNPILSAASNIHIGDYEIVAAHADFALSTYDTYVNESWAREPCDPDVPDQAPYCEPTMHSVFQESQKNKLAVVIAADVLSGGASLLGDLMMATKGQFGWAAAIGKAVFTGLASSTVAVMAMH